jgi:hypothetical protein
MDGLNGSEWPGVPTIKWCAANSPRARKMFCVQHGILQQWPEDRVRTTIGDSGHKEVSAENKAG